MSRTYIFSGPTISSSEIASILPDADVLPPISAGDLLRLDVRRGDRVVVLDGYYYSKPPVRHKELLHILNQGIPVLGAASMGALRAAELARFGMGGSGEVFHAFLNGTLDGDDEVAVLHGDSDTGYMPFTEALVNIRKGLAMAKSNGVVDDAQVNLMIDTIKSMPFAHRTMERITSQALISGMPVAELGEVVNFLSSNRGLFDIKRRDAVNLLHDISINNHGMPSHDWSLNETAYLRSWKFVWGSSSDPRPKGVSDADILTFYRLFGARYKSVHRTILRAIYWLHMSGVIDPDIQSVVEVMNRANSSDLIAELGDHLAKVLGLGREMALPAPYARWLRPDELSLGRSEQLAVLLVRLWSAPHGLDWRPIMIEYLKFRDLYSTMARSVDEIFSYNSRIVNNAGPYIDLNQLSMLKIVSHFAERWEATPEQLDLEVRDRGFRSQLHFHYEAKPFYLASKRIH